jgi:hypothetical protein
MRFSSFSLMLVAVAFAQFAEVAQADDLKGNEVKLDKLSSTTPADWKSEKPNNRLRSYQFRIPGAKDAKTNQDAEVFIFPDLTKTVDENFARYKEMFVPPDGKTVDDIAKTSRLEVGKAKVAILDMEGTWLYKERPFDPKSKQENRPDSRVISVIFTTDDGNYLIRLSGPASTVSQHAKAFFDWIKAFK